MLLDLQNVSRSYPRRDGTVEALRDVSLTLDAGDFTAVRGASGCGKTTLLLTAGALLRPDAGQVTVAGEDPYAMTADARATFRGRMIGFVFQQFHLVPYLSVLDNVLAPALAVSSSGAGLEGRARELIERFGLSRRINHVSAELSSGERQRAALARALLNQPKLLLADEPTGNLDPGNADAVLGYLAEFAATGSGAVLLVTHDDRAITAARRVVQMRDGQITPAEV